MNAYKLALIAALLVGCGDLLEGDKTCTQIGCTDGFWVTALASEGLRDGSYEIQLMLDETAVTCTHPALVAAPRVDGNCSARNVRSNVVIHNGGTIGTGAANAFLIDIVDTASRVELRVLHDGQLVGEARYEPTYQTIMPNGPECGPTCTTAPRQELRLDFE
jgi:hypothetical protein